MNIPSLRPLQTIAFALILCCGLALPAAISSHAAASKPFSSQVQPNHTHVLFGGDRELVLQEGKLGRILAVVRSYYDMPGPFPWYNDPQLMAGGRTLVASFDSTHWVELASGKVDKNITNMLTRVNEAAIKYHFKAIYVDFEHEADIKSSQGVGTPAQFVAAWRHIYHLAASQKLNWQQGGHLRWVLILDQEAFPKKAGKFWPGRDTVDILGDDAYQFGKCYKFPPSDHYLASGKGVTPAYIYNPVLQWATANAPGVPIFLPEWGSVAFKDPLVRPAFIRAMTSFITSHPEIHAELYWDAHFKTSACDMRVDSDPASLAALIAMGKNPNFQGLP